MQLIDRSKLTLQVDSLLVEILNYFFLNFFLIVLN